MARSVSTFEEGYGSQRDYKGSVAKFALRSNFDTLLAQTRNFGGDFKWLCEAQHTTVTVQAKFSEAKFG